MLHAVPATLFRVLFADAPQKTRDMFVRSIHVAFLPLPNCLCKETAQHDAHLFRTESDKPVR